MNEAHDDAAAQPRTLEEACTQLYEPLCEFVRRRAAAMYGRVHLSDGAEGVVQRVFEAARTVGWDTIRQPRAWLYAVARRHLHAMADWQRAELPTAVPGPAVTWTSSAPVCTPEVGVAAVIAGQTLSELPNRQRQVAHLRFHERWTFTEIASALGISEAAARVHVPGAREVLRAAVPDERTDGPQVWWKCGPRAEDTEQPARSNVRAPKAKDIDGSVRRADLISVLVMAVTGALAAGISVPLGGVWGVVALSGTSVLILAGAVLAARYLWAWHLWAWHADWRRERARARPPRSGSLAKIRQFLRDCSRAMLFPWWRLWWLLRNLRW
ncbi:RNA polymerase sigma factor [Amycolatopsis albispora]|uniref:RNA polymerase sigma-70 region 4 domain-containing protein n=1 Tax=Amycolatopsis albispora TaxID=1804986 RepID=A0A344L9R4_9PSEU|nr:RNA polymerase sigma factor [Amycolatopsis albispora]AXB44788.1 hypothetical protein A4R43_21680 [Amycolatopsis albispora]